MSIEIKIVCDGYRDGVEFVELCCSHISSEEMDKEELILEKWESLKKMAIRWNWMNHGDSWYCPGCKFEISAKNHVNHIDWLAG